MAAYFNNLSFPFCSLLRKNTNSHKFQKILLRNPISQIGTNSFSPKLLQSCSSSSPSIEAIIESSQAYSNVLAYEGLISVQDRDSILQGFDEIERRIEAGEVVWRSDREDVRRKIEETLTDLIGEPAKKLHTARSGNDQICTDFRLCCRDAIDDILKNIKKLQVALVTLALKNENTNIVLSYLAQPVLLGHLLLAYVEQLNRDAGRLTDCKARLGFTAPLRNRSSE